MRVSSVFQETPIRAGMYESFYLRAVSPDEPVAVWIRNTVHKAPGQPPRGAVWCTLFDSRLKAPFMHKVTSERLTTPAGGWIEIGGGSRMGPDGASGSCGEASWELTARALEGELRHLSPAWLYRAPLPRTKLTSPAPLASFSGTVRVPGREPIELDGWHGMVGHNWGSEHAARWIWLHGVGFDRQPGAWLDIALGRVAIGGRLTPWLASGAISAEGRRIRVGGLASRGVRVDEGPRGCTLLLPGSSGHTLRVRAAVPAGAAAGWRYADPGGGEHDVLNCSVAALEVELRRRGGTRRMSTSHGGAYELGMSERTHGMPIAPFADG